MKQDRSKNLGQLEGDRHRKTIGMVFLEIVVCLIESKSSSLPRKKKGIKDQRKRGREEGRIGQSLASTQKKLASLAE